MTSDDEMVEGYDIERKGDWPGATDHWRSLIANHPSDERLYRRAVTCALNAGDALSAAGVLGQALAVAEAHWEDLRPVADRVHRALAAHHSKRARSAFDDGDYLVARAEFAALLELVPDHPWAEEYLVRTYGLAGDLDERLRQLDRGDDRRRFYITGCGRSGTWLIASMMGCFEHIEVPTREEHFGRFALLPPEGHIHVLKRQHDSYKFFSLIPAQVSIINIVRHPFDVLTSSHRNRERYISLDRYESEMRAYLDTLVDRPSTMTIRYEDLVSDADGVQIAIQRAFGLTIERPFSEFHVETRLPTDVAQAMQGIRRPSTGSVERWRHSTTDQSYIAEILRSSNGTLQEAAKLHGYAIDLA